MSKYEELIERLKKAIEPSWGLDAAIAETIGWRLDKSDRLFPWADPNGDLKQDCPHYTASLDAALTLARDQHEFMEMLDEAYHKILPPSGSQFAIKYNALRTQMVTQFPAIKAALLRALRVRAEQEKK